MSLHFCLSFLFLIFLKCILVYYASDDVGEFEKAERELQREFQSFAGAKATHCNVR